MHRPVIPGLLALAITVPAAAASTEPKPIETTISAVTVYADRAQVTRTAAVTLGGESRRFQIGGLPGWIDPESVRASLTPGGAGQILDVTVEKSFLLEPTEASVRNADTELREITDQLGDIDDEERVLLAEVNQLEAVRAFSLEALPKDMATREVDIETFAKTVDFVTERLRKTRAALRTLSRKRRDLQPELVARTKVRDDLRARSQLEQQNVTVEVRGTGKATLALSYLTSGATWEPKAELRVGENGRDVSLVQLASVVQSTGEDWENAKLTFSTQLPGETLAVPEVTALLLGADGAGLDEAVQRASASFQKAQSSYVIQNKIANYANPEWQQQQQRQAQMQQRATASFQKLAKRGTTAHFDALTPRTVRADGKSVRVPIGASRFKADSKLVAVPEVSLNVVRTAQLVNSSELSILPGPASLFVDGAFLGTSELPFVAPGESFSTFLGIHEGVKLERTIDRKRSSIDRGRRRTTVKASFVITAENLAGRPVSLEVGDRLPVAQDDDIELDDEVYPSGATRDANGVVKWNTTLAKSEKRTWRIEYTIEYPNDFLARGRPAPAKQKRMLYDQIEALEHSL